MKKFFIVAIICIVTASLALFTYNFMATKEKIMIDDVIFYVNIGDDFTINYDRVDPKSSTQISITYDGFEDYIEPTSTENNYIAKSAGRAVLKLDSNISGFSAVTITVYIGDGSEFAPHYIDDASELSKIGSNEGGYFKADAHYNLTKDIDLENQSFEPICDTAEGFNGLLNFAGHTISNVLINSANHTNAGLFAKIGKDGKVLRASLKNVSIEGAYNYAGALAGINLGNISSASVKGVNINDTQAGANVGGLVGYNESKITSSYVVGDSSMVLASGLSNSNVGGLVGYMSSTSSAKLEEITKCYTQNLNVHGDNVGGLVGILEGAEVRNSYSRNCEIQGDTTSANVGGLVGKMNFKQSLSNLGSNLLNVYTVNHIDNNTGANFDALVGYKNEYSLTEQTIDTAHIVMGAYYFGSETTSLTNGNFVFVGNVANVQEINANTFITKTNVTSTGISSTFSEINFDETIWDIQEAKYPELILEDIDATSNVLRNGSIKFVDNNIEDIINNESSKVILNGDIDGNNVTKASLGILSKELDGAGYTIKNFKFTGPIFKEIVSKISNITFENITVTSSELNLGILTSVNHGTISNVKFINCHIIAGANNQKFESNIGIVAGINNALIQDILVKSTEDVTSKVASIKLDEVREGNVNLGLLVGKNYYTLKNASVSNGVNAYIGSNITKNIYVGGAVGANNDGSVEYVSVGFGTDINAENSTDNKRAMVDSDVTLTNITIGGVAGYNQSSVKYCKIAGVYYGHKFGGIVGENNGQEENDVVEECEVTANTWVQGMNLGGLISIENLGLVQNCATYAVLNGYNETSRIGGICVELHNYAPVHYCFVSTTFTGEGDKHYGVGSDHIHDLDDDVHYVIINTKNMDGAKSNNYNETQNWVANVGGWFMNIFMHFETEIRVTDEECHNLVTYTNNNFDENIWILGNEYPKLYKLETIDLA